VSDEQHSKRPQTRQKWFAVEDAYYLMFHYKFNFFHLSYGNLLWLPPLISASSEVDCKTVILDSNGRPYRHILPSHNGVRMSLKELLRTSGRPNWLEEEQAKLGANLKHDTLQRNGPVGRLSGLELTLQILCFNGMNVPSSLSSPDWNGKAVCSVQVIPSPSRWVQKSLRSALPKRSSWELRVSEQRGIRCLFATDGEVRYPSLASALRYFAQGLVLVQLPAKCFRVFMLYFLGHMSLIYGSVLDHRFSLAQHVTNAAVKLMSTSVCFSRLADTDNGISLPQMFTNVKYSLQIP